MAGASSGAGSRGLLPSRQFFRDAGSCSYGTQGACCDTCSTASSFCLRIVSNSPTWERDGRHLVTSAMQWGNMHLPELPGAKAVGGQLTWHICLVIRQLVGIRQVPGQAEDRALHRQVTSLNPDLFRDGVKGTKGGNVDTLQAADGPSKAGV